MADEEWKEDTAGDEGEWNEEWNEGEWNKWMTGEWKKENEWTAEQWEDWQRWEKLKLKAEMPLGNSPSTDSIVTWVVWQIEYKGQILCRDPGRLFYSEIPKSIDKRIHEMLQPVFSHINRDDHSERACFLHLVRAFLKRCGWEGSEDCSGWIRCYITHFPCISCVAVTSQFIRFFPAVRLEMDFDNMWKTRFEPPTLEGAEHFHEQDGLVGRRKKLEALLETPYKDPSSLWQRVQREILRDGKTITDKEVLKRCDSVMREERAWPAM